MIPLAARLMAMADVFDAHSVKLTEWVFFATFAISAD
jgi:hypothetical protein